MSTAQNADAPLHLSGNNAPITEEVTVEPAMVIGAIPEDLNGVYLRNGPNPRTGWSPHYFSGDGMVHAVALRGGRARWYRNRYVRTPLFAHPGQSRLALAFDRDSGKVDYRVTTANTHVVAHAGRLLALEEGGFPYEITPELETVGPFTFADALHTPMTAHPKICPRTGELLFFGVRQRPPFLTYYRAAATGELLQTQVVPVPRATMMHDFAITETYAIFMDLPVVFDPASSGMPWRWDDRHGARFGVMRRDGGQVRWFDVEPCYVWHTMNAFETDGAITVTGCRVPTLWRGGSDDVGGGLPRLHRWRLDPSTGSATEQALDDAAIEYPRVADADVGQCNRFGYVTSFSMEAEPDHSEIYKYDFAGAVSRRVHRLPAGHTCGEAAFVARAGAADSDDGYLMTFVHDRSRGTSYLAILDAADPAARPIAEVHLPVRIPTGFHGNWLPDH
ncbi:carotenoid oxygenase family protein [Nocardia bhagyanarayanae]|uniref:Dioxygenase n=1 Tax=Nocardia bhagyanarayanae TaxID=1215925 RepID=A0A543EUZ1_9NOCA|nr:carotenoid oxygenase family protein [Nocardia bhagyanarayanae]TQM25389.1 carotenoid cleavage dioxygenase [Nocardia bhagyanarayanae]